MANAEQKLSNGNGRIDFVTEPSRYKHWKLSVDGDVATLLMDVDENAPLFEGYQLKLNSYDLGVDIELADAIERIRFGQLRAWGSASFVVATIGVGIVLDARGTEALFLICLPLFLLAAVGLEVGALLGPGLHGGEHEFALHRVGGGQLADLDDRDQLVELLRHLLDGRGLAVDHHGHARVALVLGGAHREREDVVPASGEQAADPREHAGLVLHEHAEDVVRSGHHRAPFVGPVITSSFDAPAGTIGNTFSR